MNKNKLLISQKPHKIWPWLAWFVVSFAGLFQFVLQTSTSVMMMDLQKAFSLNAFQISVFSSSFFYTYLICQIPAGILIDCFKPRRTVFICQLVLAFACLLLAKASNVWMAETSRILMGLFCAPTIVAALYLIAHSLPEKYFSLVAGLTETMGMLGGVAGEALLARSVTHLGWRETMLILAGIGLAMSLLALVIIRDETKMDSAQSDSEKKSLGRDLMSMLMVPQAWINGLFCGLLFGLVAAFGSFWCIPFLMARYGINLGQAADASSMIFIGAAIGAPIIGWWSDKIGKRRIFMMSGTLLALFTLIFILYVPNVSFLMMFALILLLGFFSGVYLLSFSVMRDLTPLHRRGAAMGYINMMCILIGAPILQPLIGWLLSKEAVTNVQAYQHAFLILPLGLIFAFLLSCFIKEHNN